TVAENAVFFGPDTYRFCDAVERYAPARSRFAVDVGCGSGAGGIVVRRQADRVLLTDVNEHALELARVNVRLAQGSRIDVQRSDVLASVDDAPDLVIANPPYMKDDAGRTYRDGGGNHGEELAARIVREALAKLAPGGTLLVYTGAAIVDGEDIFWRAIDPLLEHAANFTYREIDPDVFGEELAKPAYANVDRIAAVVLVARVRS
ncbi:MAG: class I SAM-dependent methyltransferase, partial [Polyangiaceae bacterium]